MLNVVRIPARDTVSRRTLVVLHGLGDSHEGWEWLPRELDLPWLNCLLVDAPEAYFGGFSWFGLSVQEGTTPRIVGEGVVRSRALINELIDHEVATSA